MTQRAFTSEQEAEILQMRAVGISATRIVTEFGGRANAVYAVFRRHAVPLAATGGRARPLSPADGDRVLALWEEGLGITAIGREIGRSTDLVRRQLERQGVEVVTRYGPRRGGERVNWAGYVLVPIPRDHPYGSMRSGNGTVFKHRLVMAETLGRPLTAKETVHHLDGNRQNNDLSNLQLRQGRHGAGVVLRCTACGGTDLEPRPLAEQR